MSAANPELPDVPVELDDALYAEMLNTVGYTLAFPASDAAWRAICRAGFIVIPTRTPRMPAKRVVSGADPGADS